MKKDVVIQVSKLKRDAMFGI